MQSSPPGEVIGGRYQILGLLGVGGMGSVYRARDLELDELVALKMIRQDLSALPDMLDRFRREVKLARRVTDRHVARTFDIGEHGDQKFLTMELVEGESLAQLQARTRPLPLARVVEIAEAVCAGLSAAHQAGVVHRDLKPDNVLLARDGRVLITDFGIARAFEGLVESNTVGMLQGTPAYMAPEQVEGAANLDARADLFALGVMLYELTTGQLPFSGTSAVMVAAARLTQPAPDPRLLRPDLPDPVVQVIRRCLERRPVDRFASAREVAALLSSLTLPVTPAAGRSPAGPPGSHGPLSPHVPLSPHGPSPLSPHGPSPPHGPLSSLSPPSLSSPPIGAHDKWLAVLPLRNAGPPEDDYLADGLTEELIDTLSMTRGLRVRSRSGVMYLRGVDRDPREVGRELDVQVVVEGSLRRMGAQLRVTTRLVSVVDGFQIWAKRFDRPPAEVLQIGDEAAAAIAGALTSRTAPPVRAALVDPRVVDLYLRARHEYHRPESVARAVALFEEALAIAPDDPALLSACALARVRLWVRGGADGRRHGELAREAAERAVLVGPDRAEPHVALASVRFSLGDAAAAVGELKRALAISPSLADAHDLLGRISIEVGRIDDGIRHLEVALLLDPALLAYWELVRGHALLGHWQRAEKILSEWFDRAGDSLMPWYSRVRLALWRRDLAVLEEVAQNHDPRVAGLVAAALELVQHKRMPIVPVTLIEGLGDGPDDARRRLAFLFQIQVELAGYADALEPALAALEQSVGAGLIDLAWLDRCPLLAAFRSDPRFIALRTQVAERVAPVLVALRG